MQFTIGFVLGIIATFLGQYFIIKKLYGEKFCDDVVELFEKEKKEN